MRTFGRRALVPIAKRALAREILFAPLAVIPLVDLALLGYFIYEIATAEGPPVELPRDRNNAADRAITWPASGWTNSTYNGDYYETSVGNGWGPLPHDVHSTWYANASGSTSSCGHSTNASPHVYEAFPGIDPLTIPNPATPYPRFAGFSRFEHQNLWDTFPGPGDLVGDTHGQALVERHIKTRRTAADPTFTNPPRTAPSPGTGPVVQWVPEFPPAPAWRDIPGRSPNEFLSPHEQVQRGPAPDPRLAEDPASGQGRGRGDPSATPDTISPGVGSSPASSSNPGPPRAGEKERKMRVRHNGVVQAIRTVFGEVTEFLDALQAFYMALPVEYRPGYYQIHAKNGKLVWVQRWKPSIKQRAEAVYRNFDKLDLNKVWRNVARNEITDRIIGKGSQVIGRASRVAGLSRGLQSGPWDGGFGVDIHKMGGP